MEIPLPILLLVQAEGFVSRSACCVAHSSVSGTASTALVCSFIFASRWNVLGAQTAWIGSSVLYRSPSVSLSASPKCRMCHFSSML